MASDWGDQICIPVTLSCAQMSTAPALIRTDIWLSSSLYLLLCHQNIRPCAFFKNKLSLSCGNKPSGDVNHPGIWCADTPQWRLGPMFCRELCNRCGTRWQRAKNTRNPQGFFVWVSPHQYPPAPLLSPLPLPCLAPCTSAFTTMSLYKQRCGIHIDLTRIK